MTGDSKLFRTRSQLESDGWVLERNRLTRGDARYLPLYEGKMFHHFDHRWATYDAEESRDVTIAEKQDPTFVAVPRYWVSQSESDAAQLDAKCYLIAFRDITNSTNERTMIVSLVPRVSAGNNAPLLSTELEMGLWLPAVLSSFAHDFFARLKFGGTHANFFLVEQLPVLTPEAVQRADEILGSAASRVAELTYTAWDMEPVGAALGAEGPPFRWDTERRSLLRAELDACFFHLYGIERDDVDYIMDTFPIVKRKDEASFGEYRTKRLILEVYDAMAKAIETGEPYQTILDPPPADPSLCHPESTRPDWAKQA